MELNKRKSLLSPALPTVWGMIYGDISNQTDINDRVKEIVVSELGVLDLSEYIDLTGYATENWVEQQNYLTEHQDLTGYATETWVLNQSYLTTIPSEYITETELNTALEGIDLTGYATENWVEQQNYLTEHQSLANYYTKNEVDTAIENVEVDLTAYATIEYVNTQIGEINTITEDILS